jgi:hypothetical protein
MLTFLPDEVNKKIKYNSKDNTNENTWQNQELELHTLTLHSEV